MNYHGQIMQDAILMWNDWVESITSVIHISEYLYVFVSRIISISIEQRLTKTRRNWEVEARE